MVRLVRSRSVKVIAGMGPVFRLDSASDHLKVRRCVCLYRPASCSGKAIECQVSQCTMWQVAKREGEGQSLKHLLFILCEL